MQQLSSIVQQDIPSGYTTLLVRSETRSGGVWRALKQNGIAKQHVHCDLERGGDNACRKPIFLSWSFSSGASWAWCDQGIMYQYLLVILSILAFPVCVRLTWIREERYPICSSYSPSFSSRQNRPIHAYTQLGQFLSDSDSVQRHIASALSLLDQEKDSFEPPD